MQHGENRAALARAERAGRGTPRRRSALGPPPAVVGRARQPERRTRGGDAQPRSDLGDRCHHEGSVVPGVPSNAATCFCRATRASARSARFCHRLISRACSASFLSRGSTTRRAGPRGFAAPASSPRSRAARHVVRADEYSHSRRTNAPTAPGVLQPSASRTIFRLYSTVNRRRVALATTSIAGPPRACSNALIALRSCLALDSKLPGGHCLTHVGREGATQYTANFDGKDNPLTGSQIADTVSLKRIDQRTSERTDKKAGAVAQTLRRVVSQDGKMMTVTVKGKNAQGQDVNNTLVFEKQ